MMRALWLHYSDDAEAVKLGTEYLWGRDLLVAPVMEKGAKSRRLYLPAGQWYDWWTNENSKANAGSNGRLTSPPCPSTRAPAQSFRSTRFVSIPAQPVTEPATLRVFPGASGVSKLYDDDGQSLGYATAPTRSWFSLTSTGKIRVGASRWSQDKKMAGWSTPIQSRGDWQQRATKAI
jgi:alpha-glucosidase/alpha-D-xyloside xylohydrolase